MNGKLWSRGVLKLALAGMLAPLLLNSCAGTPALAVQNQAEQRFQGEHARLRLRFIDETELIERYGRRDNLFIAPPGLLSRERFIAFDFEVGARREPVLLALNQIEMSYGGRNARPVNQFHHGQYWQQRDEQQGIGGAQALSRQRTIRQVLPANQTRVAPRESESGMLLFRGSFPQFGAAVITVQLLDQNERPLERATFTFEF